MCWMRPMALRAMNTHCASAGATGRTVAARPTRAAKRTDRRVAFDFMFPAFDEIDAAIVTDDAVRMSRRVLMFNAAGLAHDDLRLLRMARRRVHAAVLMFGCAT